MDFSFASTALYYALYLLGAGSIGYLLVRLSYPDIRLLDRDAKLGVSAILGFFMMCVSLALEWGAGHAGEFGLGIHSYQGLMPLFSFVLVVVTFGIMKVYFLVNSPRMLTVGLPIHSASNAAKAMEAPGLDVEKPRQAVAAQASAAPLPSRPVATVTLQPSGLFGFVGMVFKKRVPQTEQRKQELIEIEVPIVQHITGARPQAGSQKPSTVQFTSIDFSDQAEGSISKAGQKQQAGRRATSQVKADANVPAPFVAGLQEKEFSQKPQKTPQPSFASKAAPFVAGIPKEQPRAASQKQKPLPSGKVPADEAGRKKYYDQKINELLSGFPTEDAGQKAAGPAAAAGPVQAPLKSRKEIEAESEMIIEDLVPAGPLPAKVQASGPGEPMHRRLYEQPVAQRTETRPQASDSPEQRRRMYAQPGSIRVIAPRGVSETDEFADIISDIYSQLKTSAREDSLNDSMKVNVPPSSAGGLGAQTKASSAKGQFADLEDELFGSKKPVVADAGAGTGLFDQLSKINAVEGPTGKPQESGLKSSSDMEFVHISNEAGMGCPTCHQRNSRIVFCPYCGSGMCTNCSPNVRLDAAGFVYSCPKCGEEVHIKKKAATPAASF